MIETFDETKRLIRLPVGVNLYEAIADGFVRDLTDFAEKLHRMPQINIRGVLILQTAPAEDRTPTWLKELETDALLYRLADRIDDFRWLLSLVRHSPVPWVFASAHDCLGAVWELALSCQKRYWFRGEARLGFPDVEGGAFPPGGVLESLDKRIGRTKERWLQRATLSADEAVLEGYVDFCSDSQLFEATAARLFNEMLALNPRSGVRDEGRKGARVAFDIEGVTKARMVAIYELEAVRREASASSKGPSTWDYCWQLVKEKRNLKPTQAHELGRLIAHIAAHHYLSYPYRAWLASGTARSASLVRLEPSQAAYPAVTIDLNFLAPPTDVLVHLLMTGVSLLFVGDDAKSLASALNTIYGRLEKAMSSERAEALWQRLVHWSQGVCDDDRSPTLRWAVDDRFVLLTSGQRYEFLRVEGNSSGARPGLLEWTPPQRSGGALPAAGSVEQGLVRLVSNGLIETRGIGRHTLPVSHYVRSVVLEELVSMARYRGADLDATVEGLNEAGWGFAGQEPSWERFVRARLDAFAYDPELHAAGPKAFARSLWEAGTWKHVKSHARRNAAVASGYWNATALSHHLATFAGLLVLELSRKGHMESLQAADYLTAKALGFPNEQGTPLHYLRRRGRRRVEHYAARHWPELATGINWSDFL